MGSLTENPCNVWVHECAGIPVTASPCVPREKPYTHTHTNTYARYKYVCNHETPVRVRGCPIAIFFFYFIFTGGMCWVGVLGVQMTHSDAAPAVPHQTGTSWEPGQPASKDLDAPKWSQVQNCGRDVESSTLFKKAEGWKLKVIGGWMEI